MRARSALPRSRTRRRPGSTKRSSSMRCAARPRNRPQEHVASATLRRGIWRRRRGSMMSPRSRDAATRACTRQRRRVAGARADGGWTELARRQPPRALDRCEKAAVARPDTSAPSHRDGTVLDAMAAISFVRRRSSSAPRASSSPTWIGRAPSPGTTQSSTGFERMRFCLRAEYERYHGLDASASHRPGHHRRTARRRSGPHARCRAT